MSDAKALMRAIIENPDDDAPRLVYADWLDDHGDPDLADCIRVQCALSSPATPDDLRSAYSARAKSLAGWRAPKLRGIKWPEARDRGFPRRVEAIRWADLRDAWDTIFSISPVVWVTIQEMTIADLNEFLARPKTGLLQYLFIGFDAPLDRVAEKLAVSAATDGWIDLVVGSDRENALTDRGAEALLAGPHLRRLASLTVTPTHVSPTLRTALQRWTEGRIV